MSLRDHLADRFVCPKCETHGATVRPITSSKGPLAWVADPQKHSFLAATCGRCGYTELYDASVLDDGEAGGMFDLIF